MNKVFSLICCITLVTSISVPSNAYEGKETNDSIQSISIPNKESLLNHVVKFKRVDAKIITVKPWLNSKAKSVMLTNNELRYILRQAGFSGNGLKIALEIVWLESTNRPYALNKKSNCYGLFQINMTGSMGPDRRFKYGLSKNEDLFDPLINAKIAYHMSDGGKNWSAWSTEKSAISRSR